VSVEKSISDDRAMASLQAALAPIATFLESPETVEVMLNADGVVWVEAIGRGLFATEVRMSGDEAMRVLRLAAALSNSELNDRNPSLSAKLPISGARLQGAVPPIVDAPVFALRLPPRVVFTLEDYVSVGIITAQQSDILREAVRERRNIIVAGGTGSGKTTLLNALLHEVAKTGDRVYIVEDTPELVCSAPNRVQVLVHPPLYTHQRAIVDALRFRPDRILVGEVRDGSALDLIKAWNTGHPGGLASLHANSTRAALDRICQLIEEVVPRANHTLVADTVDICVHIQRDKSHPAGRSITAIDNVMGFDSKDGWVLEPASFS
jgi:type IV secretion system protein VirB11